MKNLRTFHLFYFICAVAIILVSCRLYTEGNQDDVDKLSAKTEMQPFDSLENPLVLTFPVEKELYLFGNKNTYPITETVGNIYLVYDLQSAAIFDWAFFEGRNTGSSIRTSTPTADGRYYSTVFESGDVKEKESRLSRLDATTGKIEECGNIMSPYGFSTCSKYFFSDKNDAIYEYDDDGNGTLVSATHTLTLIDTATFEQKTFSFSSEKTFASFAAIDNLYVIYQKGDVQYLSVLSDNADSLQTLFSWNYEEGTEYYISAVDDGTIFLDHYEYKVDEDYYKYIDLKSYYVYDLNSSDKNPRIFPALDETVFIDFFKYDSKIWSLCRKDGQNYELYRESESDTFEKVKDISPESEKEWVHSTVRSGNRLYILSYEYPEISSYKSENMSVRYVDLDTLEIHDGEKITAESIIDNK